MKLKYNWENNPDVKELLNKIYTNTIKELEENNYSKTYANEFLEYIEDFIMYFKSFSFSYDFTKVVDKLKTLELISFIKPYYFEYGKQSEINNKVPVINMRTKILLNPSLEKDKYLTKKERRRLYLYHGLLHNVIELRNDKTIKFSKIYSDLLTNTKTNSKMYEELVNNGWLLLEESLIETIAEKMTYSILEKEKPGLRPGNDKNGVKILHECVISSDLELYREFQPILLIFGITLNNVGSEIEYSREILTYDLIRKAINTDFSKEVINEYISKGNEFDLYKLLYYMGLIVNEKYAALGFRQIPKIKLESEEIDSLYFNILDILKRNMTLEKTNYSDVEIVGKTLTKAKKAELINIIKY